MISATVHVGGDIGSIIGRLNFCWKLNYHGVVDPPADKMLRNARPLSDYLRSNALIDSMGFNPTALKAAVGLFGIDRIVLGTDFGPAPYGVDEHILMVQAAFQHPEDRQKALWKNADRLFMLGLAAAA